MRAAHAGRSAGRAASRPPCWAAAWTWYIPPENRRLYEDIAATGVLLSEYPPGTEPPAGGTFPSATAFISGLSLAALVVEAPEQSRRPHHRRTPPWSRGGTCLPCPARIDAAASVGCNRLIRDGAGLAASESWDILSVNTSSRYPHQLHPAHVAVPEPRDAAQAGGGQVLSRARKRRRSRPKEPPAAGAWTSGRNRGGAYATISMALIRVLDSRSASC